MALSPYQAAGSAADAMAAVAMAGNVQDHYAGIGAIEFVEPRQVNGLLQKCWSEILWTVRADKNKVDEAVLLRGD